ncbi:hypothetical protein EWM64_g10983 [Hericium alpestre]|uniref:Uncharacterized protein n=1 Tax=Hericium alpestre TaxID=135208 RepID=A0A4Y9ZHR1_9AGAM|nr:hypothetical protein EWM64_g10983 [Hericium alpestre]
MHTLPHSSIPLSRTLRAHSPAHDPIDDTCSLTATHPQITCNAAHPVHNMGSQPTTPAAC